VSQPPTPELPTVVFGDLEADVWGVLIDGISPLVSVSSLSGPEPGFMPAEVQRDPAGGLNVTAAGVALRVEPAADPTSSTIPPGGADPGGPLRLASVRGAANVEGVEREFVVSGLSLRNLWVEGSGHTRLFAGWFPAQRTLGLLATRAPGAKGHDRDVFEVAGSGEEQPVILDPRLSTTYDGNADPIRVGIELWLADSPEAEESRSRRLAAVATGSRAATAGPAHALSAHALRCVSRSELGAGVYLIAHTG